MFRSLFTACLLSVALATGAASADAVKVGDLTIEAPFAHATPPRAPVAGGYMIIKNSGSEPDRLIGGSAAFAGKIEIHEMKVENDVMKMREIEGGLVIPAGGSVALEPGGYHVMFMKLAERLQDGETRKATLVFERAGEVELDFAVRKMGHGKGHSGHDHKKHDHGS